jgi:hypothetical protein|nr:MAG TPA: hypothetical protein [Caudoviricetes sp.]
MIHFDIGGKPSIVFAIDNVKIVHTGGKPYTGGYTVIPKANAPTVLETAGKTLNKDVTVTKIPYYETSNPTGDTVYIASEV